MNERLSQLKKQLADNAHIAIPLAVVALLAAIAAASWDSWAPQAGELFVASGGDAERQADDHEDDHDHDQSDAIVLSEQARRNIGLKIGDVKLQEYSRSITFPAMLVEHAGRSHYEVAAPMTGVIMEMTVLRGQAASSGDLLFRMRLTHEDLVRAQAEFLRTLGELDAEEKEIARLKKIAGGGVAERLVLEREYARDKLNAVRSAQEESLQLHGLSVEQVAAIGEKRKLIRELQVRVPWVREDASLHDERGKNPEPKNEEESPGLPSAGQARRARLLVEELPVHVGQAVKAGETLCVLADYHVLHLEGRAFEQDAEAVMKAARDKRPATAVRDGAPGPGRTIDGLEIVHVDNTIDPRSRALNFHVELPNTIVHESQRDGRRFFTWRFKPGQRMQLKVPVDVWKRVVVLPVEAVAREGPEFYVFVENGKQLVRRPVAVKYRDQFDVVVEYDGSISPGERVALNGAHQLQTALKNLASGPADPHAGHSH